MMKKLPPTHGLTLLALAVALTGCPGLETGAKHDPAPQPSASAPAEEQDTEKDPEKEPTVEIQALGPVRAALQGAPTVEHGPITVRLDIWSFYLYGELGYLLDPSLPAPEGTAHQIPYKEVSEGRFQYEGVSPTKRFHALDNLSAYAKLEASHFAIGEVAPTGFRKNGERIELDFPAGTTGPLMVDLGEGDLRFTGYEAGDYLFPTRREAPMNDANSVRSATVSVTVAVKELDGTPTRQLSAANFQIARDFDEPTLQATETAPGVYRVSAGIRNLRGLKPQAHRLTLTVRHARFTHTHTKETP